MLKNPPHRCTCKAREVPASYHIIKPLWQEANPAQKASAGPHRLICRHCLDPPDFACDIGLFGQAGQADRRCAGFSLNPQDVLVSRNGPLILLLVMVLAG